MLNKNTTCLFKSSYSIGKSILNLDENSEPNKSDSIFQIAQDEKLNEVVLVEDSMGGLLQAYKAANKLGIKLIFGLRLSFVQDLKSEKEDRHKSSHKNIIFVKNKAGYERLIKIYSLAATEFYNNEPQVDYDFLKSNWNDEDLSLAVPFYDSYLMNNILTEKNCIPNFFSDVTFFEEDNQHPFDFIISDKMKEIGIKTEPVKTVYYRNRKDFRAWQTFKCLTSRKFGNKTLSNPNLEGCCSDSFCIESLK